jgi:hypothetical protein
VSVQVLTVSYVVLSRRCTDVTLLIPVALDATVDAIHQHVVTDVEFAFLIKQWFLYVFLEDVCTQTAVAVLFF